MKSLKFPIAGVPSSAVSAAPIVPGSGTGASAANSGPGALAGLSFDLSIMPVVGDKPPRFGHCANWVECTLGCSNWFQFERTDTTSLAVLADSGGNGDLNLTLAAVPLPAGAVFFAR